MKKICVTLYGFLFSLVVQAVDPSVLWLPKKYKHAHTKLMSAAKEAEATDRCKFVVAGELMVSRSTQDSYHFVITCRDQYRSTYNLVYKYPVESGGDAELVVEQNASKVMLKKEMQAAPETVKRDKALELCNSALDQEAKVLGKHTKYPEEIIEQSVASPWAFGFDLPISAFDGEGREVRYIGKCQVALNADVNLILEEAPLTDGMAKAICREAVKGEAILLGNFGDLPEQMTEQTVTAPWMFGFDMLLISHAGSEQEERHIASCLVDSDADVEVAIEYEPINRDIAMDICFKVMEEEATLIGYIDILEEEVRDKLAAQDWVYRFILPFNSQNDSGDDIRYNADCRVDSERGVDVEITIDVTAIADYCIDAMEEKTKMMLNKQILRKAIEPTQLIGDDYFTAIPFTANSPTGLLLNYQANCTVTSAGKSTIEITGVRKKNR